MPSFQKKRKWEKARKIEERRSLVATEDPDEKDAAAEPKKKEEASQFQFIDLILAYHPALFSYIFK